MSRDFEGGHKPDPVCLCLPCQRHAECERLLYEAGYGPHLAYEFQPEDIETFASRGALQELEDIYTDRRKPKARTKVVIRDAQPAYSWPELPHGVWRVEGAETEALPPKDLGQQMPPGVHGPGSPWLEGGEV